MSNPPSGSQVGPQVGPGVGGSHQEAPVKVWVPPLRGTHLTGPHLPVGPTTAPKWVPTPWTYPTRHPLNNKLNHPCPHCGAPTGARCITRTGNRHDGYHKARARLARRSTP